MKKTNRTLTVWMRRKLPSRWVNGDLGETVARVREAAVVVADAGVAVAAADTTVAVVVMVDTVAVRAEEDRIQSDC